MPGKLIRGTEARRFRGRTGKKADPEPDTGRILDLAEFEKSNRIQELHAELIQAGYDPPQQRSEFREWLREQGESSLFFFVKWVLEQDTKRRVLFGRIHEEISAFLTDYSRTRRKLLMIAVGHLKTTFGSHGLPLHVIIQRPTRNIYFPGEWGCDQRIALANESEAKCKENLQVIAQNLMENSWLRWLWPHVCPAEAKPKRWTDFHVQVPRYKIFSEPTVTAIGAETGFMGRHYSLTVSDDLAGIKAGQSAQTMARAKRTQAALRSRLDDPWRSIEIEIGTHQSADDIYSLKKKDPTVEVMCRAIEERPLGVHDGPMTPIWPEKYPREVVDELRKSTDAILWALWYMNKPVASGYTALDWEQLREFRFTAMQSVEYVTFEDIPALDRLIYSRYERRNMHPVMRLLTSMPKAESLTDIVRRQSRLGMSSEQAAHLRDRYSRCEDCGTIYQNGGVHECVRNNRQGQLGSPTTS